MLEVQCHRTMELLLGQGCKFAIENSMILHNPEVKEKLEELGIPVLIERSSYEKHPLGRLEWIRLFGVLLIRAEWNGIFREQVERVQPILEKKIQERPWHFLRYHQMERLPSANRMIMYLP